MEHIKIDEIHAYMEGQLTTERRSAVEGHLAVCQMCGNAMMALSDVCGNLRLAFRKDAIPGDCPEDWALAAFIKQELSPELAEPVRAHINNCGICTDRAAAYFKASSANPSYKASYEWKESAISALSGEQVKTKADTNTGVSFSAKVLSFIKKASAPAALPGYALAAAASLVLLIWGAMPEKAQVVTIASSERLVYRESGVPASFGFMGSERVERFEGMEIEAKKGELLLKWKNIEGAKTYSLSVINLSTDENIIKNLAASRSDAAISLEKIRKKELHRWIISGTTQDGESFEYTGEFLIAG